MSTLTLLPLAACGACALLAVAAWRPAYAGAALAFAIPITAGMARGAVVPVFRVNEALLAVAACGFLIHLLVQRRAPPGRARGGTFVGLDLVILVFCAVNILVPWGVILLSRDQAGLDDWLVVMAPIQYLAVYILYSRTEFSGADLRLLFNLLMLASIVVAVVAVAELFDFGGARQLIASYYPRAPLPPGSGVYRPSSLLGHYSAVGAFGLVNFLLAFALAAMRYPGFSGWWLALVMGANLLALVASQTYAPVIVLPLGALAIVLMARRLPWRQLAAGPPVLAACAIAFWPAISGRLAEQAVGSGGFGIPETLQTRIDYWQGFFVPALLRHGPWLGTGTLIPPEVPRPLVDFVDNGYLWAMFRAGIPGLAVLIALIVGIAMTSWRTRTSGDSRGRTVAAVCLGAVVGLTLLDTTSEYLTFTGVSQEFWMLVGLLAGLLMTGQHRRADQVIEVRPEGPPRPGMWTQLAAALSRLAPERFLLRGSMAVLLGFGVARALGFAFQVAAARILLPDGYGRLTYALAVANVATVLLTTGPLGLSRFLSRSDGNRADQEAYYANWLTVVAVLLGASAFVTAAVASPLGLGGWMLAGLLANLLGVTALETYREVQRGLGRFVLQSVFYVLANLIQLAAVIAAAALGWRSPALFLIIYGLSSVAALAAMAPFSGGLRFSGGALRWRRMLGIAGYIRPVLLQAVFWNVWFNVDLLMLQHLRSAAETGTYAAAKTIANGFTLLPTAIAFVFAPRVAQLADVDVRGDLARVLGFTAAVIVPLAIGLMIMAGPLTSGLYGGRYGGAAIPLAVLLAAIVPYGLRSVLGGLWLGLGHPVVETVSSGVAMVVTVGVAAWLIPQAGSVGAATAFGAGAVAMLLVDAAVSIWAFSTRPPRLGHLGERHIIDDQPESKPRPLQDKGNRGADRRLAFLVAEELTATPDEGYVAFVRALESKLPLHRPMLIHVTPAPRWDRQPLLVLSRIWHVARAAPRSALKGIRPGVVVYLSRCSLTLPALFRGWVLKRLCGSAPLVLVALQAREDPDWPGLVYRLLAPDLLLVPTHRDRDQARAKGLNADVLWSGVDLGRFHPPSAGEKEALRRKWQLPLEDRIILHVGHLREGRNLRALMPLAQSSGVTVVVAGSDQRGPESYKVKADLESNGVVVVDGYRPNIEELYRLADCYVFPTVAGDQALAMPLSILEALASDLPVVTTKFGALPELFGTPPGIDLVETPDEIPQRALTACGSGLHTRHLAGPYSWDAIVGRLVSLLHELQVGREIPAARIPRRTLIRARLQRIAIERRALPRRLIWSGNLGYEPREPATPPILLVEDGAAEELPPLTDLSPSDTQDVAVCAFSGHVDRSALAATADFLGLRVSRSNGQSAVDLLKRATGGRWKLLAGRLDSPAHLPDDAKRSLTTFVNRGGTLYLDSLTAGSADTLRELGNELGFAAPEIRTTSPALDLHLAGNQAWFARELAGATLHTEGSGYTLEARSEWDVLAHVPSGTDRLPAVVQRQVGLGRVVLSVLPDPVCDRLTDTVKSDQIGAAVVALLLLRQTYGHACWHPPAYLANFTIDDPALRQGMLGLPYDILAAQARDHGFHVTIATVPRELHLADEAVIARLREQGDLMSACYHGCDHRVYEFYRTHGSRTLYAPRPLEEQRRALWRAVEHGRRFTGAHHYELDRVMVFPYGVGPASIFPDMHRLGFLATCNYGDKFPLEAAIPTDDHLGLRPADLGWEGFPLLWRRGLRDQGYLLDLLLGRPILIFAHRRDLGRDFKPFVQRARSINRAARGAVQWRSLDEVARHAYLQRHDPRSGWEVMMTSNEACLHNPDPAPRTYTVKRPNAPAGDVFFIDGRRHRGAELSRVTIAPGEVAVVRLAAGSVAALRARYGCTVLAPALDERRSEGTGA